MNLSDNLKKVRENLPANVNILAVSKGQPPEKIRELAKVGQVDFGESRLQEALNKQDALSDMKNLRWHFIGHLQRNKVRAVVKSFSVIHSVESLNLAERISRIALEEDKSVQAMIQVKLRKDPTKGGIDPFALVDFLPELIKLPNINFTGLMTMAPIALSFKERSLLFRECRNLADKFDLPDCSMGMSGDWESAVNAGATWLRLGSVIFECKDQKDNNK